MMFERFSARLASVFERLSGQGVLSEKDIEEAVREVRRAMLDADVALPVTRSFIDKLRHAAKGQQVVRSVTPGQMIIKIIHDLLVDMLGEEGESIDIGAAPPFAIMLVGLQGSGKTTSCAKIACHLRDRNKLKILMASLDTQRPAAQEQLKQLGETANIDTLPIVSGQTPLQIARRAKAAAALGGYDAFLIDTAGRSHIDEALMREMAEIRDECAPHEILLVADALMGQDAVNLAEAFDKAAGLTGIVLTRMDGDGRGGAALSMRAVTGKPIKLIGTGEKLHELDYFQPSRIAGQILGRGDLTALIDKVNREIDSTKAAEMAAKIQKGRFDLDDMATQLRQLQKIGGMSGIMGLLPGVGKIKKQMANSPIDDRQVNRQLAIIQSMTPRERAHPDILKSSRKKRVASGAGAEVSEINKLLKLHRQMHGMMKKIGRSGAGFPDIAGADIAGGQDLGTLPAGKGNPMANFDPAALGGVFGGGRMSPNVLTGQNRSLDQLLSQMPKGRKERRGK